MKSLTVNADVAGTVWKILVELGDTVRPDQDLMILESMKMEIPASTAHAGVVRRIFVEQGQVIGEGQELMTIELA